MVERWTKCAAIETYSKRTYCQEESSKSGGASGLSKGKIPRETQTAKQAHKHTHTKKTHNAHQQTPQTRSKEQAICRGRRLLKFSAACSLIHRVPGFGERLRRALRWPKNPPLLLIHCVHNLVSALVRGQDRNRVSCHSEANESGVRGMGGGGARRAPPTPLPSSRRPFLAPSPLLLCPGYI